MKRIHITILVLAVTLMVGFGSGYVVSDAHAEKQPLMRMALKHLQVAKTKLQKASHDKGGHRVKALEYVNQAIVEVKKGIKHDNAK